MKKLFLIIPLILMACTTPQTPAQTIYLVESDYAAALKVELAYSDLPRCDQPTSPVLCSKVSVIKIVQKADNTAWAAIQEAQTAVRTPGYGENKMTTAISSAKALVKSFVSITSTLRTK